MFNLPGPFGTLANLLVIILGFGSIIFVHELGHFLAAKWAGIRVLAFSMGMGPVVCSYRKGIGWRKGSSEPEYRKLSYGRTEAVIDGVSPTEYRLSALPLGGYVKMLGQEDINPGAISDAPDSYQNRPVWKRMVVICAGVVMNILTAGILFIWVFMVGLRVEPAVIGAVADGSPASRAVAIGRDDIPPGLQPEDTVLTVNGRTVRGFNEMLVEVAMASRHDPVRLVVERPGEVGPIEFESRAEVSEFSGFLELGVGPALSVKLETTDDAAVWDRAARLSGLPGVPMGSTLTRVNGLEVSRPRAIMEAVRASGGGVVSAEFADESGDVTTISLQPRRDLPVDSATAGGLAAEHLLGLTPLLRVDPEADPKKIEQGLAPGDVFVRIGETEYPSFTDAITTIRANTRKSIPVVVERAGPAGTVETITLVVDVNKKGQVGFSTDSTAVSDNRVGRPTRIHRSASEGPDGAEPAAGVTEDTPAMDLIQRPGTRVLAVAERPVSSLLDIAAAIDAATAPAFAAGTVPETIDLPVLLELPLPEQPDGSRPVETRVWTLTRAQVESVRDLGWTLPRGEAYAQLFVAESVIDKAEGPIAAVGRGVAKSRQVMNQTYLTFLRLFQGTVKVEHLKGPVGIAHLGTKIADQGFIWVLFFLGLVSVNLAVINFLPLPIVDGGQFLMLAYEGLRGRPMPIVVQNAVTLAGLVLVGSMFLIVTFHDIKAIFGV